MTSTGGLQKPCGKLSTIYERQYEHILFVDWFLRALPITAVSFFTTCVFEAVEKMNTVSSNPLELIVTLAMQAVSLEGILNYMFWIRNI